MGLTPKERARGLCNKYLRVGMMIERAKECALVCVDEILSSTFVQNNTFNYWSEVKEEINKL
jgi:hypothetical protein